MNRIRWLVLLLAAAALAGTAGFLAAKQMDVRDAQPAQAPTRPIRSIMVGLAQDAGRINDGLWHEDFEMIRLGARGVADHPKLAPDERALVSEALGEEFAVFVAFDTAVHEAADAMADAASTQDVSRILDLYRQVQNGCLGCHTAYRTQVRQALAASLTDSTALP